MSDDTAGQAAAGQPVVWASETPGWLDIGPVELSKTAVAQVAERLGVVAADVPVIGAAADGVAPASDRWFP